MGCVQDTGPVDIDNLEIGLSWFGNTQVSRCLHDIGARNSRIGDDCVDAAVGTEPGSLFEEIDLRLPVGYVAVDKVHVLLARLFLDVVYEGMAVLHVDVPHDNHSPVLCPMPHKSGAEAARSPRDDNDFVLDPSCVVGN